jgi:hypothetical protein
MDDNKNQNQTNPTASDYQKILDEYAASVKPEDNQTPQNKTEDESISVSLKEAASAKAEPEKPIVPQNPSTLIDDLEKEIIPKIPDEAPEKSSTPELKSINSPQLESPIHPSLAANLELDDEPEKPVADLPSFPPKEDSVPVNIPAPTLPSETPVDIKPEKSPEEIKAEINRLLTDDETKSTNPDISNPTKTSSVGKVFFIFALILFLIIAAGLAYFLFLVPSNTTKNKTDNSKPSVTPTSSETNDNSSNESGTCELNNKTYQVGESFTSADGCNTCSCSAAGVIACTEKACAETPTVTTATKSATVTSTTTKSTIPTGWKTYTSKDFKFSISLPSDWKLVFPADGSLDTNPLTDKSFDDNGAGGLLTTVSSPDKKQEITIMNTFDLGAAKCITKTSAINNLQVKKITCSGLTDSNAIPGPVNYEFVGKGLYITTTSSTTTIDSVISNIKFN